MAKKKLPEEAKYSYLGQNLNFAASEAYKLLRTNILFSLPNTDCKVVGITSSLPGEGKTTTAINLAYTIAETGKKVLLVECDMRIPSFSKKMELKTNPGLSNILAGLCTVKDGIQQSDMISGLQVITSGDIPPNPAELLGSSQMEDVINVLAGYYDYIVLDLPPITAVSDALVLTRLVSGMIVVVRKLYCSKSALKETMNMVSFLKIKVLGFVMTYADRNSKGYYSKGYRSHYGYRKYGSYYKNRYGYGYGYGEGNSAEKKK